MNNSRLRELLDLDKSTLPADGGTAFNRLIFARSPYLLQHAENPVDWREWSDAAFAEARQRDLPLLISIGYATCHWCHVMAAESFSDAEVAAQVNSSFVAVKVDREERPDIDDFFMTASRVLTGSGGWPLNVFVDHDRRPFFAITYLPKEPRQQTPGFLNLLANLSSLWQARREMVFNNASEIECSLRAMAESPPAAGDDIASVAGKAMNELTGMFDLDWGGFGRAVKFPMPTYLRFLLSRENGQAREMALQTLAKMAAGGINDQLAGGFHRYTTDRHWQIPHFEKMLYDQALLITTYLDAFAQDGNRLFLDTAVSTADFAVKELLDENGAFCAGLDADSEGEEGLYYTWNHAELAMLLGNDFATAASYWGITPEGNLDGRSTLHRMSAAPAVTGALAAIIGRCRERLLIARSRREPPLRDPKVICAWNGLMISALVRLAAVTGDAGWLRQAADIAAFILKNMVTAEGRLLRNWLGTPAPVYAFAEDYAYFCLGLADLAAAGKEPVWTEKLAYFGRELLRLFINAEGGVTFAGSDTEGMPVSIPPLQDGVMPSAAGACATLLIRMAEIFANRDFAAAAGRIIANCRGVTERNPAACLSLLMAEEQLRRIS